MPANSVGRAFACGFHHFFLNTSPVLVISCLRLTRLAPSNRRGVPQLQPRRQQVRAGSADAHRDVVVGLPRALSDVVRGEIPRHQRKGQCLGAPRLQLRGLLEAPQQELGLRKIITKVKVSLHNLGTTVFSHVFDVQVEAWERGARPSIRLRPRGIGELELGVRQAVPERKSDLPSRRPVPSSETLAVHHGSCCGRAGHGQICLGRRQGDRELPRGHGVAEQERGPSAAGPLAAQEHASNRRGVAAPGR
mmetsp:Transcript_58947/g.169268  ORF Transcript_58947/g.169268 Transcript_58947/m.169268 type:complete len:249 (-) Transcript_58947:2020-2766(-)